MRRGRSRSTPAIPTGWCAPASRSASTISTSPTARISSNGIGQFDAAAKARGVCILSAVSSFPVLTAAVVRRLTRGMTRLDRVTGGIAPSPYAGVGRNVIRAIASYAGKPVRLRRDGRAAVGHGLAETRRYTIAPPGQLPLRPVLFSLVDVPDLQALPELWPELRSVWMGVGPVPEILHRMLIGFATAVRFGIVPSLARLAAPMHAVTNVLRWGEDRGGMFVAVEGADAQGRKVERSWHMIAEGGDGPLIPSMAAEAIIRQRLAGRRPDAGARAASRELELSDYEALFARRQDLQRCARDADRGHAALPAAPGRCLCGAAGAHPGDARSRRHAFGRRVGDGRARRGHLGARGCGGGRVSAGRAGHSGQGGFRAARRPRGLAARFCRSHLLEHPGGGAGPFRPADVRTVRAVRIWGSRWCARRTDCGWWFGAGVFLGFRCRPRLRRSVPLLRAPKMGASTFTSKSGPADAGLIVRYRGWLVPRR